MAPNVKMRRSSRWGGQTWQRNLPGFRAVPYHQYLVAKAAEATISVVASVVQILRLQLNICT
jgi:hypothetical protein